MSFILKFWKKLQGNWSVQLATDVTGMEVKRHCLLFCLCKNVLQIFYQSAVKQFLIDSCVNPRTLLIRESTVLKCVVPQVLHQSAKAAAWNRDPLCPSEAQGWSKSELDFHLRRPRPSGESSNCRCSGKQSCSWRLLNLDDTLSKKNIPYSGNRPRP